MMGRACDGMSAQAVPAVTPGRARYALGVLFTINLFNYIDRQVISGVLPLVQQDLRLSDTGLGWLASAFMILYLSGSIPLGVLRTDGQRDGLRPLPPRAPGLRECRLQCRHPARRRDRGDGRGARRITLRLARGV